MKQKNQEFYTAHVANIKGADISGFELYFPSAKGHVINSAENIINHSFEIFGIFKDFGHPINWSLDPKTDNSWPKKFWGDINYRDGKTIGGIKFAWELNRFHHFPQLAIAFVLTRDYRYKEEIFSQLKSWMDSNPYPKGINWIMGIELGIRIVNIVYTLKYLGDEPLSPEHQNLISKFIAVHGKHLYRYPSKYTSGGNHAIAEALGLFVVGLCFPDIDKAKKWKSFGKKVLEKEVVRQIYPDGSSFEHSIPYLQFVLDHFLIYYLFCKENNEPFSKDLEDRLRSSFDFIFSILDRNGNSPNIGDDDSGYLLKFDFEEHNNFVSLLNTGAILFGNPGWILENSEFDQKTFFLLGGDSKLKWNELKKRKKSIISNSRYFKNAGIAVIRNTENPEILFIGNSGPLGLRPLGGHGHADALSFWLSIDGQPIFIDPGTYLYHSGGKWRDYFRSTSAHNTLKVDSLDQATIVSDFMFKDFYNVNNPYFQETADSISWSAGHDGYMKLKDSVFHKRKVTYLKKEKKLIINDTLDCMGPHKIECFFHLHPFCSVSKEGHFFDIRCDEIKIRLEVDKMWGRQEINKGGKRPLSGWYSPYLNRLQESYSLILGADVKGSQSFCSIIYFE